MERELPLPSGTFRAAGVAGAVWHISNAWTFPNMATPADRVEVVCGHGSVELELGGSIRVYGAAPRTIDISAYTDDDMLLAELTAFADAIRSGTRPSEVTLADAKAGLAAADAIQASIRSGTLVTL